MKSSKSFLLLASTTLLLSLSACGTESTSSKQNNEDNHSEKVEKHKEEAIDYKHQDDWKFESGNMQSPININTHQLKHNDSKNNNDLTLSIQPKVKKVEDNGHAIEVKTSGNATINGRHFTLEQFHIHTPSEHTINGKAYPAEIHFVTKASDGRIAVIASFVEIGKENKAIAAIEDDLTHHNNDQIQWVKQLLPNNMNKYYHYLGSLTTPPLTENVEWYVLSTPIQASKEQVKKLESYHKGNNRKVQPVNERVIEINQ